MGLRMPTGLLQLICEDAGMCSALVIIPLHAESPVGSDATQQRHTALADHTERLVLGIEHLRTEGCGLAIAESDTRDHGPA